MSSSLRVGDLAFGKVLELQPTGALVGLATGEVGFLHLSEIPEARGLAPGQEVLVKVIGLDRLDRPALSIRRVTDQDRDAMAYHQEAVEFGSALASRPLVAPPPPLPEDRVEWRLQAWLKTAEGALGRLRRRGANRPSPKLPLD